MTNKESITVFKVNKCDVKKIKNKYGTKNIKTDDVLLIENNESIINNYLYNDARVYLSKKIDISNYVLEFNKFGNIFNIKYPNNKCAFLNSLNKEIEKNIASIKNSLKLSGYTIKSFSAEVCHKIIVGLGESSVYENNITLHHTYGIPYIPGQAIKGMLRNYIINKYLGDISDLDSNQIQDKINTNYPCINEIFGMSNIKKSSKGKIIFLDSFPNKNFKIALDVMTPHHKDYYADENPKFPCDNDEVTPIKFLVVENRENYKLNFIFNLAIKKDLINNNIENYIKENLEEALLYIGIGAKTALGYGHFINFKEL